ncbi:MAG: A24 family peptidase [Alphaproteobacteria bacterium]
MNTLITEELVLLRQALADKRLYVAWLVLVLWAWLVGMGLLATCALALLAASLLLMSAIDLRHMILPLSLTLPTTLLGLILAPLTLGASVALVVVGLFTGFLLFAFLSLVMYLLTKRESLGLGDAQLLALIGAWGGVTALLPTLLIASFAALAMLPWRGTFGWQKDGPMPFGPFLALGGWVSVLHQDAFYTALFAFHRWIGLA